MKSIEVATRRYNKEDYIFILELPSYKGEKGCLGIELTPRILVITPENWCGYNDYFHYDDVRNNGYFSYRSHPNWIKRKIIDVCHKNFDKWIYQYSEV